MADIVSAARPCRAIIEDHCIVTRGIDVIFDGLLLNLALISELVQPGDLLLLHQDDFDNLRGYLARLRN